MFYSARDKQCNRYMCTGLNSKSKKECVDAIFAYLMSDNMDEQDDKFEIEDADEKESFVLCAEFEIEKHKEEIPEEY